MKALKSKLATKILADPTASDQLRDFLINKKVSMQNPQQNVLGKFVVKDKKGAVNISATVVPKAVRST